MRRKRSKSTWFWGVGFNRVIDFCVWVLETDGLHVPPFDQHPRGDEALRTRGMDERSWLAWLDAVVDLQNQDWQIKPGEEPPELYYRAMNPAGEWRGEPAVGELLADLWAHRYPHWSNKRKEQELQVQQISQSEEFTRLWRELRPYHRFIPPLHIYLVGYPGEAEYVMPPRSSLFSAGSKVIDVDMLREHLYYVAEELMEEIEERIFANGSVTVEEGN